MVSRQWSIVNRELCVCIEFKHITYRTSRLPGKNYACPVFVFDFSKKSDTFSMVQLKSSVEKIMLVHPEESLD